jgi:phosphatidylinositol alpha-1,6-mannosyltransferase
VPHVLYRALWFPALRRMEVVIANSHATAALAARIGVPASRIHIVHPGVELPVPDPGARARFRTRYGLGEAPVLLSVGRLSTRKGLREFVSEVMPALVACHPALQLVVIGDAPHDALRAQAQTPESIRAEARRLGLEGNLRFLGPRFGVELADAYAGADVHVFPIRHLPDDPEGFGMVAVEASAHGLPTVAYATGGVVDAVQEGVSGRLVPAGDAGAFTAAVLDLLERPFDGAATRAFAADFAWPAFGAKVTQVLDDTVQAGPT